MKQTIALVDDDRNILTSVSMTLEQEGFQVRTYTDGESALQGLTAKPADLAVGAGAARRPRHRLDRLDHRIAGVDIDARIGVGKFCHLAAPRFMRVS